MRNAERQFDDRIWRQPSVIIIIIQLPNGNRDYVDSIIDIKKSSRHALDNPISFQMQQTRPLYRL